MITKNDWRHDWKDCARTPKEINAQNDCPNFEQKETSIKSKAIDMIKEALELIDKK
jgi:hypothetical protein